MGNWASIGAICCTLGRPSCWTTRERLFATWWPQPIRRIRDWRRSWRRSGGVRRTWEGGRARPPRWWRPAGSVPVKPSGSLDCCRRSTRWSAPVIWARRAHSLARSWFSRRGRCALRRAWQRADPAREPRVAATIAQRLALHAVGRLNGADIVEWTRRAVELAPPYEPVCAEAQAVLGLGLAWQGRLSEGLAVQEASLAETPFPEQSALPPRIKMAHGWLLLADDDIVGARAELMETAPAALARGSIRISLWAYSWLALTDYAMGNWDEAILDAERAVALLGESGHAWLRPLVRWAATVVPAARGDWQSAEEHVRLAVAQTGDYELMMVGAALARAHLATARGDNDNVLRTLDPLTRIQPREAIDEPGFWPWRDLYADALVNAGLLEEADAFLAPREALADQRGRRVEIAKLCRVRGRRE